jgi:acyl-CoA synthetase (AMP-forming)/AMP-acid ligase II
MRKVESGERKDLQQKLAEMSQNIDERDGCLVIYTTGSTSGYPKPALLCHQGITVQNLGTSVAYAFDDPDGVILVNMPPSHVGGLTQQFMTALFVGAKSVLLDMFKPDLSLEAISKYKVTHLGQIPAMYNMQWRMANYLSYNLSSLKVCLWGGQAVTRPFVEQIARMTPKVGQGFGMTELSGAGTYSPIGGSLENVHSSAGYFMPISPLAIRAPILTTIPSEMLSRFV